MSDIKEEKANIYLKKGALALSKGLIDDAQIAFNKALEHKADYFPAMHNLGLIQLRKNNPVAALPFLLKSAKINESVETYSILGECYEHLGELEGAIKCYEPILKKFPEKTDLWIRNAEIQERLGRYEEAKKSYEEVIKNEPNNININIKLAWILWKKDQKSALQLLEKTLPKCKDNTLDEILTLSVLILFKEWSLKLENNELPYHAQSLDEMFFKYTNNIIKELDNASSQLLKEKDNHPQGYMIKAIINFITGKTHNSQKYFQKVSEFSNNKMTKAIRFDKEFFNNLDTFDDKDLLRGLPPVDEVVEAKMNKDDILYLSCNSEYFDCFAKPLLVSLNKKIPPSQVHIHLIDSNPNHTIHAQEFCFLLKNISISISVERPTLPKGDIQYARSYFHAIRFIRFYHHLLKYQKRLWLMDVDALFNNSPKILFDRFNNKDISLRVRPARLEPWNQFNACLLGINYSKKAIKYIHNVAAYIAYFYQCNELPWGIDQLAMYASYQNLEDQDKPSIGFLDDIMLDYDYNENGLLWCSSGTIKFAALNKSRIKSNLEVTPYELKFKDYRNEAEILDEIIKSG
jgi:tetratricopeptide (TPR) repeat protein